MEITTKQTAAMFPVFIAVISATVLVIAWRTTCGMYVNESMKQSESVQLNVNAGLIGKSYPAILGENIRIKKGSIFVPTEHIKCQDAQDGNITGAIRFYGSVDTRTKGVYKLKCVAVNSLGLKTVKYVWILLD